MENENLDDDVHESHDDVHESHDDPQPESHDEAQPEPTVAAAVHTIEHRTFARESAEQAMPATTIRGGA